MKRIAIILISLAISALASAQSTIRVQAPNLVAVGEQFNVMFVIEGEGAPSSFEWTAGDDFQLVWGPQKGRSSSISIVNGKKTTSSQVTYTYILCAPAAGNFTLSSAEAVVKGETLRSKPVSVQVVSDPASQGGSQQKPASGDEGLSTGTVPDGDLFVRLHLSKSRAVVGETMTATLKLYQRTSISGIDDAKFPSFTGFWSQELQSPTNIEFKREALGDKIYNSAVLRSWTLIPQQSGELRIDPAEIVCSVTVRAPGSSTGSIFDSFFQDDYRTVRKRLVTEPHTVHVTALPSGAPASFGGGVGNFKMSASLTRDSLRAHDAASLVVNVTGTGNVALLEAPGIAFPPDFEVYDVKVTETSSGKSFEYPFIPRSHGSFDIGPVEYSYYDVSKGRYETLSSRILHLDVSKGAEESTFGGQSVAAPMVGKDVRNLGNDIRYIETGVPAFSRKGEVFAGSVLFWLLGVLLAGIAAAVFFVLRAMAARRADVVGSKSRSATKMARKRLSDAGDFLAKGLYSAFYEELHRTLLGFVSDKLNMDMADMSKDNISRKLSESGVDTALCDDFVALLDACEFARYAPDNGREAMSAHYESAVSVISTIDERMKKRPSGRLTLVTALMLLLVPAGLQAGEAAGLDSLWNEGVRFYESGDWASAGDTWSSIVNQGYESPELYCNLGNAFFKQREYAYAILNYERALKLDPSYSDAKFNLEYLSTLIQDRIEVVPEFFLKTWTRKLSYIMPSQSWAVLFLVLLALALAMLLMFLLSNDSRRRKLGFFASIAALLLALVALAFSLSQRNHILSADEAVVVSAVTSVKSSPGSSSVDLFVLHEGAKVTILESVGTWSNIELQDGRQGWIPDADIECI